MPERTQIPLTAELHLLIAASWLPPAALLPQQQARLNELSAAGPDWSEVLMLARRHRMAPLVYHTLIKAPEGVLPPPHEHALKADAQAAQLQALKHAGETRRLLQLFHANNIPVIPLKGAELSLRLFGDLGLRQTRDVDLLVQPEDVDRAQALLLEDGYVRKEDGTVPRPTQRQERHLRSAHYHYGFLRKADRDSMLLELHWRRENCSPEHMRLIWERSLPGSFLGAPARMMDEDMELLFLCDHGAHHRWFRIKWLSDVAMLMSRRDEKHWDRLCALAERLDLSLPLAQALLLVHWLYDIPLPGTAETFLQRQPAAGALAEDALEAIQGSEVAGQMPEKSLQKTRFLLRLRKRPDYRHYARHLAISWADFEAFPLSDRFFWMYALCRPVFWLGRKMGRSRY